MKQPSFRRLEMNMWYIEAKNKYFRHFKDYKDDKYNNVLIRHNPGTICRRTLGQFHDYAHFKQSLHIDVIKNKNRTSLWGSLLSIWPRIIFIIHIKSNDTLCCVPFLKQLTDFCFWLLTRPKTACVPHQGNVWMRYHILLRAEWQLLVRDT